MGGKFSRADQEAVVGDKSPSAVSRRSDTRIILLDSDFGVMVLGRLQAVCQQGRGEQQNQQKMGRARCLGILFVSFWHISEDLNLNFSAHN